MGDLLGSNDIATGNAGGTSAAAAMLPIPLVASAIAQTLNARLAGDRSRSARFIMACAVAMLLQTRTPHGVARLLRALTFRQQSRKPSVNCASACAQREL